MSEKAKASPVDELRRELLYEQERCTESEMQQFDALRKKNEPLPADVVYDQASDSYFRVITPDLLSEDEEERLLRYRMYLQIQSIDRHTDSIRKMMIFFVVLTIIGLAAGMLLLPTLGFIAIR
ncbi:MAG: hypothetical protein IKP10_02400 [Clostridia bacterium]|nr:hypothetical protein [Clostridia bacterium]